MHRERRHRGTIPSVTRTPLTHHRIALLTPASYLPLQVLGRVCRNPSNPSYNHYLFETIASMMRSICIVKPEAVADFEAMLLP